MNRTNHAILCFGEVLWDSLEAGLFPGGAPMNLAYHLTRHGWKVWPVSAVGKDFLGEEILSRLSNWGVETDLINELDAYPTGIVKVELVNGIPAYNIVENVAWDHIEAPDHFPFNSHSVSAVIYGSLAQRNDINRKTLSDLLESFPKALKVFDVNLRPPYIDRERIFDLASVSDLLKVNDEELEELLNQPIVDEELQSAALELSSKTGCSQICVTAGAKGAGLLQNQEWHWAVSETIKVRDTIGAGDSFLSAVVDGLLKGEKDPQQILQYATRLAGFVASQTGATPTYSREQIG